MTPRRIVQTVSLLGLVFIIWMTRYPLSGFVNPLVYFYADPLAMFTTAVAERVLLFGLIVSGLTLALTFVLGRFFCGWLCPLGAVVDIGGWLAQAAGVKKKKEGEGGRAFRGKYYILAAIALAAVFGVQLAWFFDPLAIVVRALSFSIHPFVNGSLNAALVGLLQNGAEFLEPAYDWLNTNVFGTAIPVFPHTAPVFIMFAGIIALAAVRRRFWCRYLCPLGAMLAVPARFSLLRRRTGTCAKGCAACRNLCRMNAIRADNSYRQEECILCMECTDRCPAGTSSFTFGKVAEERPVSEKGGMSRGQFLVSFFGSLFMLSRLDAAARGGAKAAVLRPPASLPEGEFVQRCIRCGNCMKVCLTNTLQPAVFESGLGGVWTPKIDTSVSYCEYQCTLCGRVCPTGAIRNISVEEKRRTKIGLAEIDRDLCIPWAEGDECLVCEEHCPVAEKAIKMSGERRTSGKTIRLPSVDPALCVGCAICETVCPVKPKKAIRVRPLN